MLDNEVPFVDNEFQYKIQSSFRFVHNYKFNTYQITALTPYYKAQRDIVSLNKQSISCICMIFII